VSRDGWLTKQGGSIRTWKKRWFVLKDNKLYYFKSQKDVEVTGDIVLGPDGSCTEENFDARKKKNCFSVKPTSDAKRVYFMYSDRAEDAKEWINKINDAINNLKKKPADSAPTPATPTPQPEKTPETPAAPQPAKPEPEQKQAPKASVSSSAGGARDLVASAKEEVAFLKEEDSKVLEFWQIWFESIPSVDELQNGNHLDFNVSTSVRMEKLTWRTGGPQNIFIQKMVDFFWNVGAPETEIDRLNDVGTLINPIKIGSWIDMSAKGGMDGGWYFPVEIPLQLALEAADPGDPVKKVGEWAEKHSVDQCFSVGRDMGAAPPRQTEIRVKIPGDDIEAQLRVALDAYECFEFPSPPDDAVKILRSSPNSGGLRLSIITSSEGFVRLGILSPNPSSEVVTKLCSMSNAPKDSLDRFQRSLCVNGPAFAEYQYLKEGFGYGVYPEGFDIVLHYSVGEEFGE